MVSARIRLERVWSLNVFIDTFISVTNKIIFSCYKDTGTQRFMKVQDVYNLMGCTVGIHFSSLRFSFLSKKKTYRLVGPIYQIWKWLSFLSILLSYLLATTTNFFSWLIEIWITKKTLFLNKTQNYAALSLLKFSFSIFSLAYSRATVISSMFWSGNSNIKSIMIASTIDLNPRAPNLNSTAFSTI